MTDVDDTGPAIEAATAGAASVQPSYPAAANIPTQSVGLGVRLDFNLGARVVLPDATNWRVRLRDLDTGSILFESSAGATFVNSTKRYYVRFRVEVLDGTACVLTHDYDARGRDVLIQFPVGTLGDILAWFPYAAAFQRARGCRLTCAMSELIIPLLAPRYPDIRFVSHAQVRADEFYATYSLGLFFDDDGHVWQPTDFRHVGLHRTAAYILGVDPSEEAPLVAADDGGPPIPEPYVCIAVQSSSQAKYWNNPFGWRDVVAFLKQRGFRVVCIDKEPIYGQGFAWTHLPREAEDQTGDRPLTERARWLRHAAAFVGLSSGLSWLAWACGCPVALISGMTHPTNEFATPYRVINYHACNSCWNDVRHRFDHRDFLWCPRHAGTARQFECTRLITSAQVIDALGRIPAIAAGEPTTSPEAST